MSDSIEVARSLYGALETGDREVLARVLHTDFTGHATEGLPFGLGGDYGSPKDMRRSFWGGIAAHYVAAARPTEFVPLDDGRLYVAGRYVGKGTETGAVLDAEFVHVLSFTDGAISRLVQLTDSQRWQEAVQPPVSNGRTLTTIDYSVEAGVARIVLNRPDQRNAIDLDMAEDTLEVARRCAEDPAVRAVLVEGAGSDLTVGGDISFFTSVEPDGVGALLRRMIGPYHDAFRIFSSLDAPIVTAVRGSAVGGGLGFVFLADIVLAEPDAYFLTAFSGIGLSGDGGGTWHLPRIVGPRRAAKMYLENYRLGAAEALEWGLVTDIVDADELHAQALARAKKLAAGPTLGFGAMRTLLRKSWSNTYSEQLGEETETIAAVAGSEDSKNALTDFVGKRRPTFQGR